MDRFQARRDRLRRLFRKAEIDALLVTNFANVTYLTGFTGEDSYLLVTPREEILISDMRFTTQLEEECPELRLHLRKPGTQMGDAAAKVVNAAAPSKLGIEAQSMTVAFHTLLGGKLSNVGLRATSGLVEKLRIVKDREEIAEIRAAVRLAERAFLILKASLQPEKTEKELADQLEHQMRLLGAARAAFPSIIAVGPRAALPHARPSNLRVGEAGLLLVDWGAQARLYKSDLTRVLVTGKISPKLERVYRVVLTAQARAIEAIRPGVPCQEVDQAARQVIAEAGFDRFFGHGLGHGIGLDIHESPRMAANNQQPLQAGMIVTVEPGIYLPGVGGVRLEDDVLVTKGGHEVLSSLPKEFEEAVV